MGVRLGLGCRLARLGERLPQLSELIVEIGQSGGRVRILEVDCGGPPLELPCVQERRQRLGHVVEDPLALLLVGLDPLPVLADAAGGPRLDVAEDVRVAADELLVDPARDRLE